MQADLQKPESVRGSAAAGPSLPGVALRSWLEGGLALLASDGRILEINESFCAWLEKPPSVLLGQSLWKILAPLCADWSQALARTGRGDSAFDRLELKLASSADHPAQWFLLEIIRAPETWFVRLNSALPSLNELEEAAWDEHLHNNAARREMFMRLLRAETRLEGMTRRWPCVIFSQRPDFGVNFASPNIKELTGISAEDWNLRPQLFWQLVHEADAAELQQQCKRAAQTGQAVTMTYRIRHALTGRVAYILEGRQPAITRNGLLLGFEVVWLDVTRQTIAERRLSAAAWKETLAVLTLGMAHDFTNIIAGIHSLSEQYLEQTTPDHPFHEGLGLIKKNSLQASQLVQRMVNLHLGQTGERNYHNLNDITTDLVELIRKTLPRRIQVDADLAPVSLSVHLDVVEFRQVVINLLLNAADAMPQGGLLTLSTSRHETMPEAPNLKGVRPRLPCVCLTIEDTGCGIKQRHLASIFDPFFTTKAKGSGLGLYNARLAMEKQQGAISVQSAEGVGTTFKIWLPEADLSEPAPESAPSPGLTRRSLLLLGPTGEMLDKTAELLRSHNFHIVAAEASEGLRDLLQSSDYHFAGVLLFAEPDDAGLRPLLDQVRQQNKNIKVALKLAGCNQDDLESELLSRIDLVLASDLSEADFVAGLASFFDQRP
ncbi:MAG TPA: ATP-binding protein [Candidatus Acidoferrum sp.]|nr:ATP-binding protein [Candidatus Acidoferrum sp.]